MVSGFHRADGIVGDLGGGSLELIDVVDARLGKGATLPLGGLSLMDASGKSTRAALKIVREAIGRWYLARPYLRDLKGLVVINDTDIPFVVSDDPAVHTNRLHIQRLGRVDQGTHERMEHQVAEKGQRLAMLVEFGVDLAERKPVVFVDGLEHQALCQRVRVLLETEGRIEQDSRPGRQARHDPLVRRHHRRAGLATAHDHDLTAHPPIVTPT